MHYSYQQIFDRLENQRIAYLQAFNAASSKKQQTPLVPGKWSAAQLLYHLKKIDEMVINSLENRLARDKPLHSSKTGTYLRSMLLNFLLWTPIKFKVPDVLGPMPEYIDVQQVQYDWETSRIKLEAFLQKFPAELRNKEIFRHPRSGMLTLEQTLTFLYQHAEHHKSQMLKNLA